MNQPVISNRVRASTMAAEAFSGTEGAGFHLMKPLPLQITEPREVQGTVLGVDVTEKISIKEQVDSFMPLREPYDSLAWSIFYFAKDHIERSVPKDKIDKYSALTNPLGAGNGGLRSMVAFASMLPFAYIGQRGKFPDQPADIDAKVHELSTVAEASMGSIVRLASTPSAVNNYLERFNLDFTRGNEWGVQQHLLEGDTSRLRLVQDDTGLHIDIHNLEQQIEAVSRLYEEDTGNRAKSIGCAALRGTISNGFVTPFEMYWHTIIDFAAQDPQFFGADLKQGADFRRDYGFDRQYTHST